MSNLKHSIEEIQLIAKSKGGVCVSTSYINTRQKLSFVCTQQHKFRITAKALFSGGWCQKCNRKARSLTLRIHSLMELRSLAKIRGGKLLSEHYANNSTKLNWECSKGHKWLAVPASIKQGTWCPKCAQRQSGKHSRLTIIDCVRLANERGGSCLSAIYKNSHQKLLWECNLGHQWKASLNNIKSKGSWCPTCSSGISERYISSKLEELLGVPFKKVRPKWLKSKKGHSLELDGYNEELKLAFEHQGAQHYQQLFYDHGNSFADRKNRDAYKKKLCKIHQIKLLVIPALHSKLKLRDLESYLIRELKRNGIETLKIDQRSSSNSRYIRQDESKDLIKLARSRGGKVDLTNFAGVNSSVKWTCKLGHMWEARVSHVKAGSWCPKCSGRIGLDDIKKIAENRGGKFLSRFYGTGGKTYKWKCENGHIWETKASNVLAGHWCPTCAGRPPIGIETAKKFARLMGGICLSARYKNQNSKLKWKCKKGHVFDASFLKVKGSKARPPKWCPKCC